MPDAGLFMPGIRTRGTPGPANQLNASPEVFAAAAAQDAAPAWIAANRAHFGRPGPEADPHAAGPRPAELSGTPK